jgi:hypothetical protein
LTTVVHQLPKNQEATNPFFAFLIVISSSLAQGTAVAGSKKKENELACGKQKKREKCMLYALQNPPKVCLYAYPNLFWNPEPSEHNSNLATAMGV